MEVTSKKKLYQNKSKFESSKKQTWEGRRYYVYITEIVCGPEQTLLSTNLSS